MFGQSELIAVPWGQVLSAISLSLLLGAYIAFVYKTVIPRLNYSVSILHTLLYIAMIVSLVMMIISNQIARAFTLVGALAVIRFRTPIKDTKDAAFIFLSLAAGMGTGVGLYLETALGTVLIGGFMLLIHYSRFGLRAKGETLVKLTVPLGQTENAMYYEDVFRRFLRDHRLINVRSLREGEKLELTFLVRPQKETDLVRFSRALSSVPQIERVSVIVCDDEDLSQNVF